MLKKNGAIPHIKITGADSWEPDKAVNSHVAKELATTENTPKNVPKGKGSGAYTQAVELGRIDPSTSPLDRALVEDIEKNVEKFRESPETSIESPSVTADDSKEGDKMLSPLSTSTSAAKILSEHERKIGHRRVDEEGKVTYKRVTSSQLLKSIQLGLNHAIGGLSSKPQRDVLMQDFTMIEVVTFPREGSSTTAAHDFSDFRFKTYAPVAFRYFRELFGIKTDDFLVSLCGQAPRELSNPGASGSVFFVTCDDEFILKTLQRKEASFLEKLLPGYYMNLNQNPRTLLPKFFGLYCYQSGGKNIRLIVMNNLIPSSIKIHEKYDLKGSTFKRKASKYERLKATPTYKDLDFLEFHPEGLMLEPDTYDALIKTLKRDCLVLESFKIMDYSFLMGVHNLDLTLREKKLHLKEKEAKQMADQHELTQPPYEDLMKESNDSIIIDSADRDNGYKASSNDHSQKKNFNRNRSIKRVTAYSTAMESIQAESEPIDLEEQDAPPGGIPARNAQGERLLCFIGIIDILQCYELKKKLEHTIKSIFHDGDTVSVHRPSFYAQRFKDFICNRVFRKVPSLDQMEGKSPYKTFRKLAFATMATIRPNPMHHGVASTSTANLANQFSLYPHKMVSAIPGPPLEPLLEEELSKDGQDIDSRNTSPTRPSKISSKSTVSPARPKSEQGKSLIWGATQYTPDLSVPSGGDYVVSSKALGMEQPDALRHFYTSTPAARPSISSSGGTADKSVPISTYKFPPLTWKPQPSDLALVDEYGNYYDPEVERDIGRELYAKSQLETAQALKLLPHEPSPGSGPQPPAEARNNGRKQRVASSLDRRKSNLSREQFFGQVAPTPPSLSGGNGRLISYKQQLKGNYSTPATPVTVQYKKLGSTSSIPTPRGSGRLSVTYHPPSPPRDYDDCSSDDGHTPSIYRAQPTGTYNPLTSPARKMNPKSPVHPASHSITPITIPSGNRFSNRSSLTNLMGGGLGARESFQSTHQHHRRLPTLDGPSFQKHASTELQGASENFTPRNYTKFSHNYSPDRSERFEREYSLKMGRPTYFQASEAREESASSESTLKHVDAAPPIRLLKSSESRTSMISSPSFGSLANNLRDTTYNNGGLTNATTTDYATACDDTLSGGSFSTPECCSREFDMTYTAGRGAEVQTPDTVILGCTESNGKDTAARRLPNIVFRGDYQVREESFKSSRIINGSETGQDRRFVNRLASYQLLDDEGASSPTSFNP